jgi:transposase
MKSSFLSELVQLIEKTVNSQGRGRKCKNLPKILEGLIFYATTSCGFRRIPREYGAKSTIHYWLKRLSTEKSFKIMWQRILQKLHEQGKLDMLNQSIDCSIVKAPGGGEKTSKNVFDKQKFGTKRSIAVEGQGIPIGLVLGTAKQHDLKLLKNTLDSIFPKIRNSFSTMHLDKGYDSKYTLTALFNYGYKPMLSYRKNRLIPQEIKGRKSKHRWKVERTFAWLNRFSATFIRWIRKENHYYQLVCLAFAIIAFRFL